ncbi:MAG: protein-disulfide isomerase, partial [Rhodopirellula sp. JB044]
MRDPIHQRMFFFADEAAMNHFFNEYERYTDAAIEVMARAVEDANPDVR